MVAVKEFSWEEISGPDFGNPARQAWPQAVAQVEEQLRAKLARNERSCHQRQSSWNSFVLNDFYTSFTVHVAK